MKLRFSRNFGCHDSSCQLCLCDPNKVCKRQMDAKYLVFEPLKSGCDMNFHIHLIHEDGNGAHQDALAQIFLQVYSLRPHLGVADTHAIHGIAHIYSYCCNSTMQILCQELSRLDGSGTLFIQKTPSFICRSCTYTMSQLFGACVGPNESHIACRFVLSMPEHMKQLSVLQQIPSRMRVLSNTVFFRATSRLF